MRTSPAGRMVRLVDRAHHVHQAELVGLQLDRIDVDLDLAVLAAEGLRDRSAGHVGDLVAHLELADVVELRLVEAFAFQGDQADRQTGRVELQDDRRQRSRRQAAQLRHGKIRDRGHRGIGVGARLEVDADQAHARQRARFDVVDAAAQREEALEGIGDVGFDLFRRHAVVERGDHNDRNVDVGKKIDRHARDGRHADHRDDQANHDDEEGIANRETGHLLAASGFAGIGQLRQLGLDYLPGLERTEVAHDYAIALGQS